ncbi:MAG: hypothetical protein UD936_07705 [Acutalibacteraceae bacterium]|nr:hypothetical protein [Acutalibacteraceae bacterium]
MLSFEDFISSFSTNSCLKNSNTAKAIYQDIIWDPQVRISMAEYSDANKPAILACGRMIENYCANDPTCDMDLNDTIVKNTVGRMVAAALAPLGYTKKRFTVFPKSHNCTKFTSGSVFHKTVEGTQKIVKTIIDL